MGSKSLAATTFSRPLANYHPNVWGDRFLYYKPAEFKDGDKKQVEELKDGVKREMESSNDYVRQLKMVDEIQRLGIEYLFEEEIDEALKNVSEKFGDYCKHQQDMYTTALSFRLLRQKGYRVTCDVFDKFKDGKGGFKFLDMEVMAVLEFFEATHLRIHGDHLLDRAFVLARKYLESIHATISNPIAEQVHNALYGCSNRRGLTRLEARKYISIYEQYSSHHQGLLKLAKMDFNLLQDMHKRELSEYCRWGKRLELPTKLSFARDRLVETYFWDCGAYFEPKYATARMITVKVQILASLLDDCFDAYGTFDELRLFANAIQKWDISCLDQLPEYLKIVYKNILEVYEEIEVLMMKQGTPYRLKYAIEAMKLMIGAFFDEAKWKENKYKPTAEEYMEVALKSCGYTTLILTSLVGVEEGIVTEEAFKWVMSQPVPVRAACSICRLVDDVVGHVFERARDHIPTMMDVYEEEHGADFASEYNNRLESAWKDLNEAFLKPTQVPAAVLYRILNFSRVIEVMYTKGDWYTHVGPELQAFIKLLYVHPIPI